MTNYKITFTGNNLFTRHEMTPPAFSRKAVESKPPTWVGDKLIEAVEAQEAVRFKPAEYKYTPFIGNFEFESVNGFAEDYAQGKALFQHWLTHEDGLAELGKTFNIVVEKEAKSFSVSYDKRFDADIDAVLAADNNLETAFDVELWIENNGDSELDYPDDTGEINNVDVTEDSGEFIEIEWNG